MRCQQRRVDHVTTAIIEGVPAGLPLTADYINAELKRRQGGYGRGACMKIEKRSSRDYVWGSAWLDHGHPDYPQCHKSDHQKYWRLRCGRDEKKKGCARLPNHALAMRT